MNVERAVAVIVDEVHRVSRTDPGAISVMTVRRLIELGDQPRVLAAVAGDEQPGGAVGGLAGGEDVAAGRVVASDVGSVEEADVGASLGLAGRAPQQMVVGNRGSDERLARRI